MKVIIAGSRGIPAQTGRELLRIGIEDARSHGIEITEIVCGKSRAGIDKNAREWAAENSLPVKIYGADYDANRASGGYMRNYDLKENGDALIAISTGTAGTEHLIHVARAKGIFAPEPRFLAAFNNSNSRCCACRSAECRHTWPPLEHRVAT